MEPVAIQWPLPHRLPALRSTGRYRSTIIGATVWCSIVKTETDGCGFNHSV